MRIVSEPPSIDEAAIDRAAKALYERIATITEIDARYLASAALKAAFPPTDA